MGKIQIENNTLTKEAICIRFDFAIRTIIHQRLQGCKTASAIGNIIGMHQQNFSKIAECTQAPTIVHIAKLCDFFDFNDSYILRGKGTLIDPLSIGSRMESIEKRVNELENKLDLVISSRKK